MSRADVIVAARTVVVGEQVLRPGWFRAADGVIVEVGQGPPPRPADQDFPTGLLVPGFIDMHVHGGGGSSYTDGIEAQVRAAASFHRGHGTTTTITSTVSASADELEAIVGRLAPLVREGVSAGIHLEGPWISRLRCGAHAPSALRNPEPAEIERILAVGEGTIAMVTLAPELPGGMEAVTQFVDAGVVVAVGHTEATYEQTRDAIARGARVATHLFNAMAPLGHREPGPPLALMSDPRVTVELVGDGVHVHSALVREVERTVGFGRVALVTDAMAAAGMSDGAYRLGELDVDVVGGVARLREGGAIAGSTATMDVLFARAARSFASDDGQLSDDDLLGVVAMTSGNQAKVLARNDIGSIEVGRKADYTVLDDAYSVVHVGSAGLSEV